MAAIEGGLPALTPADIEMIGFLIKRMRRWNQAKTRKAMTPTFGALAWVATSEHFGLEPNTMLSGADLERQEAVTAKVVESWVSGKAFFRPGGGAA